MARDEVTPRGTVHDVMLFYFIGDLVGRRHVAVPSLTSLIFFESNLRFSIFII
jgi:hypothetical protein